MRFESLKTVFGIDLRTLAVFRCGLGFLLIVDLVLRARDLTAHYTDGGVFPRHAALAYLSQWRTSLHLANGTFDFQLLLFLAAGIFAFLLMIGWRTRLMTLLSWLMLLSVQNRNPLLLQGGDNLLLMMLFWGMFLPLGARFSVDSALAMHSARRDNRYFSVATLALLVQFMSVYFFSAFLKSSPEWIPHGNATFLALNTDVMVTAIGTWARQFPLLLQGLTYFVWFLELLGPILMFSPLLFLPVRLTLMALFILMHTGFVLCLHIGLFPFISILSLLTFTPGWVWERLACRLRTPERGGIRIYYDRDCGFCLKTCLLLRTFLLFRGTPVLPAQDEPDIHALMQEHDSWVVVDHDGTEHFRWRALVLVLRRSYWFWPVGALLDAGILRKPGDRFYGLVARKRTVLSGLTSRLLPLREQSLPTGAANNLVVGFFMLLVLAHNIGTIMPDGWRLPGYLRSVFSGLRLDQRWDMFAPGPLRASRWIVAEGVTPGGEQVRIDSMIELPRRESDDGPLRYEYPNDRWRKFAYRIAKEQYAGPAAAFAAYLCGQSNSGRAGQQRVRRITLTTEAVISTLEWVSARTFYLEKNPRKTTLLTYDCMSRTVLDPEEP